MRQALATNAGSILSLREGQQYHSLSRSLMRHRIVDRPTACSLFIVIAVIIVVAYGIAWCIDMIQYGPFF
jgi:hypothetical protein